MIFYIFFVKCCNQLCLSYLRACVLSRFTCVQPFATLWTVAHQTPLSMGVSGQEYRSGLPCPPPGDLLDPGIKPASPVSPELQADSLCTESLGKPKGKLTLARN